MGRGGYHPSTGVETQALGGVGVERWVVLVYRSAAQKPEMLLMKKEKGIGRGRETERGGRERDKERERDGANVTAAACVCMYTHTYTSSKAYPPPERKTSITDRQADRHTYHTRILHCCRAVLILQVVKNDDTTYNFYVAL